MRVRSGFQASELWWTVIATFALGILTGWGIYSAPPDRPAINFSAVDWGSVGEWIGGLGTIAAVLAGAYSVRWQVRRLADQDAAKKRAAETHKVLMLWYSAYLCRVHLERSMESVPKTFALPHEFEALMHDLSRQSFVDLPDIDAAIAVSTMVTNHRRLSDVLESANASTSAIDPPTRRMHQSDRVRKHMNAAHLNFEFAEIRLRRLLLVLGSDIPDGVGYSENDVSFPPLSADQED